MKRNLHPARTALGLSAFVVAGLVTSGLLFGGPLNPPAGPITSTPGPEPRIAISLANTPGDADSLFKIIAPGSYYLTGNITGVVGKHGIEIAAGGVTLDLNGFDLVGVAGMGAFDGVSVTSGGLTSIAVVNGSVRNWGDEGVDLATIPAFICRVEGVLASGNAGIGIYAGIGCTVTHCSAYSNTSNGISTGNSCAASQCTAYGNTGNGIVTGSGCTVSQCTAYDNTGNGINTGSGCTVSNCSAYSNTGNGVSVANGSTVADCTCRVNTLDGVVCTSDCVIRGNTCTANGNGGDGAGIHVNGSNARIEGNNCSFADRGIDVDVAGNIIIRNSCSANTTDWDIVANNIFGPIIDRRAPASAAVVGFSAAGTLGSTDPNANFSY